MVESGSREYTAHRLYTRLSPCFPAYRFRECGEDLLMDVSEVLFNELAFFKLMEDFKGSV